MRDEAAVNVGARWPRARSAREGSEGPAVVANGEVRAARQAAAIRTRPAKKGRGGEGGGGKVTFKRLAGRQLRKERRARRRGGSASGARRQRRCSVDRSAWRRRRAGGPPPADGSNAAERVVMAYGRSARPARRNRGGCRRRSAVCS